MSHSDEQKAGIGLSDLITALHTLNDKNTEHEKAIFHALGFKWKESKPKRSIKATENRIYDGNKYSKQNTKPHPSQQPLSFSIPPDPEPVTLPKHVLKTELISIDTAVEEPESTPDFINEENPTPPTEAQTDNKAERCNLFVEPRHRGILTAALGTAKLTKEPDTRLLIEKIIRQPFLQNIPFKQTISIQEGCQLLLDYSDNMTPFWEDMRGLVEQVNSLVGTGKTTVYEFDQNPNNAKHWIPNTFESIPWQGNSKAPLLIATDFGITGDNRLPSLIHWKKFISSCKKQHIPMIILIPWSQEFWPSNLGAYPYLVHWNPNTTASMIKSYIDKGHEVI